MKVLYPSLNPDPLGDGNYSQPQEYPIPNIGDKVILEGFGIKPRVYIQHDDEHIGKVATVKTLAAHWELLSVELEDGTGILWTLPSIKII